MSDRGWETQITQVKPNEIRLRGYRIDELMGEITFVEAIYLALLGELPDAPTKLMMQAILVSSVDHGVTPPSVMAARTAASTGSPLNAAVAAGVLSINRFHGGAIYDCMGVLREAIEIVNDAGKSIDAAAEEIVDRYRTRKIRIAGFGHRIHSADPRTKKLFAIAMETGLADNGIKMILAIQNAFEKRDKALPINVDGGIAAVLVDLKIPQELANAFFIMARVPGLVAHVYEEQTTQRPMRRINSDEHHYDGPVDRSL